MLKKKGFRFDTSKASPEFHMAYDLASAIRSAGFIHSSMILNWDMLRKITPRGLVPILELGPAIAEADVSWKLGAGADSGFGEHLEMVYDEQSGAYRISVTGGVLQKPLLLLTRPKDVGGCLSEIMESLRPYHAEELRSKSNV